MPSRLPPLLEIGATFSPCRTWRYTLVRRWAPGPLVGFVGLNPSTATETTDDPTVRRCQGFAHRWGYGGLLMLNAFGLRSTDPAGLDAVADPIGPAMDEVLRAATATVPLVVCAWGTHAARGDRHSHLRRLLADRPLHHLGLTQGGFPKHPLYLRGDLRPVRWR